MEREFASRLSYPDPFKVSGIEFDLPFHASVTLQLYDESGKEVLHLLDHQQYDPGTHRVDLQGLKISKGIYFYRLAVTNGTREYVDMKRIVITQ